MQALTNGPFLNANDVPLEELYLHNRHRMQPHMAGVGPSLTNHQPPSAVASDAHDLSQMPSVPPQASIMAREASGALSGPSSLPSSEELDSQSAPAVAAAHGPHMEKLSPAFEERNRGTEEDDVACQIASDDADAWDFEELARPPETSAELAPSRRPDTDVFPSTNSIPTKSPPRSGPQSHRRKSSGSASVVRRRMEGHESRDAALGSSARSENQGFKLRFALRGHLDVVRSVLFTGGGSPSEPEICTAGDDGMIKRWIIPASYASQHGAGVDLDIQSYFSHRGHDGVVTCLAACPASTSFSTGGRLSGDGWIFSGGQDATVRVWERGRVDPKATLEGHTDAVWTVCVLPATSLSVFGPDCSSFGGPDRLLLGSGSADGTIKLWAVSAPPQLMSPQTGSRRGIGGSRRQSVTSGSNFPSSPQPSIATTTPFHHVLVRTIERPTHTSPTCIRPLSMNGETFVVSFSDSSILVFDTRSGEEIIGMASGETYDGSPATGINAIVATSIGTDGSMGLDSGRGLSEDESVVHAPTGSSGGGGVEGVVISGHEDQFIRFFDANSGTLSAVALSSHPADRRRPVHVQHARPPLGHLVALAQQGRPRGRLGRARRLDPLLVSGEAHLHARDDEPPSHARRGRVQRGVEPGRPAGRVGRRRRRRQGVCPLMRRGLAL